MYDRIRKACDYLDYIVEQLEKDNMNILLECRNAINAIFFDGNKLDAIFLSVLPIDKIDSVCNYLTHVKLQTGYISDYEKREQYINNFKTISKILKESNVKENMKELNMQKKYDVFISHASADKSEIVDSLYNSINKLGIRIFYDKEEISWGDNWKNKILNGTKYSEFAIIVISKNFFDRKWTENELKEFLSRQNDSGQKVILPLLLGVDVAEFLKKYPQLNEIQVLNASDYSTDSVAILLAKELIRRYKLQYS